MTSIILRDATLREGLDVPGVSFDTEARLSIARSLALAGVSEIEVVAPARVARDVEIARLLRKEKLSARLSALVYANISSWRGDLEIALDGPHRVDLLMPLSSERPPKDPEQKRLDLERALAAARDAKADFGAGFPHSTQVSPETVEVIAVRAAQAGAARITLYDTNGSADPFKVHKLASRIVERTRVPIFFHAHNDLGLAVANAWAAVRGGASGLDVTVNGLGDRAGNTSLEQMVMLLGLHDRATGVNPGALRDLSLLVERLSRVPVSWLAPVVGRFAFDHKSPAHGQSPEEFEAFDPEIIGSSRRVIRPHSGATSGKES